MLVSGYARVSTDIQKEKETIKTQTELIAAYAAANGHQLTQIYCDDGVSGTIPLADRPAGGRLLADAHAGKFRGILVYKADRIGRDVIVNEVAARDLYDGLGIAFIGIAEQIDLSTPMGRALFTFQSALGKLERENTLSRSADATKRYAKEGAWLGGICPYAFRVSGRNSDSRLVIAEEPIPNLGLSEADVVRRIYQMSAEGKSCMVIAEYLNRLGVPTSYARDGRKVLHNKSKQLTRGVWRSGRVLNMIKEPIYKGTHYWGRRGNAKRPKNKPVELIERPMPAIVSEELWNRAQETLRMNRLSRPDAQKRQYLLRALIKCKNCGLTYIGTSSSNPDRPTAPFEEGVEIDSKGYAIRRYYSCNGKNAMSQVYGEPKRCSSSNIRAQALEGLVWNDIQEFLWNPGEILNQLRDNLQDRFTNLDVLEKELKSIRAAVAAQDEHRATLFRLFRKGGISEEDLERQLAEVSEEEAALKNEVQRLEAEWQTATNANQALAEVENLLTRLRANLSGEIPWETKRRIVEALVASIEVEAVPNPEAGFGSSGNTSKFLSNITIHYRFEEPVAVDLTGFAPGCPSHRHTGGSLGLQRVAQFGIPSKACLPAQTRDAVRQILENGPTLKLDEVIESARRQYGVTVSRASVSRLRKRMGLAPQNNGQTQQRKDLRLGYEVDSSVQYTPSQAQILDGFGFE